MNTTILNKKVPALSKDIEAHILENILSKCGKNINSVPLEALESYSNYRQEKYLLLRGFIVVVLILFLLLPVLFLWPELTVRERTDIAANRRAYNVTVEAPVPIRNLTARMSGRTVPVYEAAGTEYLVLPNANGVIDVTATLKNGQQTSTQIVVTGIDNDGPELVTIDYGEEFFYITLMDDSGIDADSICLTNKAGQQFDFPGYTEDPFVICLNYPQEDMVLSVSDTFGNVLKINLTAQD